MVYNQLSKKERETIFLLLSLWHNKKQVADYTKRHPSTITREIKRNSTEIIHKFKWISPKRNKAEKTYYLPDTAERIKTERRKEANRRFPLKNPVTYHFIIEKLKSGWSPDIISWILKKEHPYNKQKQISHETIYQFIYKKENENLNLKQFLIRKHKIRRHYTWRKTQKLPKIPNRRDITERS